ncbi:MAG: hypothetical protein MI923_10690 [Phycisphaerales bacterium]|nr:hypothetical protein [Phycisphaerales bacterium]
MTSTIIASRRDTIVRRNWYLQIKTAFVMIETEDIYGELWEDKNLFDNGDNPKDSPFFSSTNKEVIGKFKDEAAGMPIVEFVGLRSKMYSYVKDNNKDRKEVKTAKGFRKYVI